MGVLRLWGERPTPLNRVSGAAGRVKNFCSNADEEWQRYQKWQLGLQKVNIPAYDQKMALNQIATIKTTVGGNFEVVPWDVDSTGSAIREHLEQQTELSMKLKPGVNHDILLESDDDVVSLSIGRGTFAQTIEDETGGENQYDVKARTKREKRSARQSGRLEIYDMLDSMAWTQLPDTAKDLYTKLGWDERNWDSGSAPSEEMAWKMLTQEQQATATSLGYEQDTWDEWNDLSEDQKAMWGVLGWDAENWETGEGVSAENVSWHSLSAEQRHAATQLGFSQDAWDDFEDLPEDKQQLWGVLGWNAENWANNLYAEGVESENSSWDALSLEQRLAAQKLGFSQDTWDEWTDLPEENQHSWAMLGWNADNWATGEGVEAEGLAWGQLSQEQREAAEHLGFSQDTWDDWSDLLDEKQALWGQLGWNADNWASGAGVAAEDLNWQSLSTQQREAASALGFSQDTWDDFEDLPAERQKLWEVLGWDAQNWASGEGVESEKLMWDELHSSQQEAAQELGFSKNEWDGK